MTVGQENVKEPGVTSNILEIPFCCVLYGFEISSIGSKPITSMALTRFQIWLLLSSYTCKYSSCHGTKQKLIIDILKNKLFVPCYDVYIFILDRRSYCSQTWCGMLTLMIRLGESRAIMENNSTRSGVLSCQKHPRSQYQCLFHMPVYIHLGTTSKYIHFQLLKPFSQKLIVSID